MRNPILAAAAAMSLCMLAVGADQNEAVTREILAIERGTLDGWQAGNPDPILAVTDPGITYFHIVTDKRIDGLATLRALFESYRGRPLFDSYEIAEPKVQSTGNTAVLTYTLVRHIGTSTTRWNATQVYERKTDGWRIIHSHWSATSSTP